MLLFVVVARVAIKPSTEFISYELLIRLMRGNCRRRCNTIYTRKATCKHSVSPCLVMQLQCEFLNNFAQQWNYWWMLFFLCKFIQRSCLGCVSTLHSPRTCGPSSIGSKCTWDTTRRAWDCVNPHHRSVTSSRRQGRSDLRIDWRTRTKSKCWGWSDDDDDWEEFVFVSSPANWVLLGSFLIFFYFAAINVTRIRITVECIARKRFMGTKTRASEDS